MTKSPNAARRLHQALEPYHGMIYFVPEAAQHYSDLNIEAPMMGYFASRSAAMGAVGPEVVIATFFNFHPDLVRSVIPAAWDLATPAEVGAARVKATDDALKRIVGIDRLAAADVAEAAALARRAAEACWPQGRPLYAAHAQLPWPEAPYMQLWHAATLLREFRGDGHIACLVEQDIGPCEVLAIHGAVGPVSRRVLQTSRAWSDDEWAAAIARLEQRGWFDGTGAITDAGRANRQQVEDRTDELDARPWAVLNGDEQIRLATTAAELSAAIVAAGTFGNLPGLTAGKADGLRSAP
ncbi:MAG: hypothetical protein ABIQ39_13135 [Ilumatobacteraceae bacterium]